MSFSESKGEQAIEKLADMIEPAVEIMTDKEVVDLYNKNRVKCVSVALKNHSKAVLTIMAIVNDEDPETYQPGILELPIMLLNFFNNPEVVDLFTSQGQNMEKIYSGSAMASIEDDGK